MTTPTHDWADLAAEEIVQEVSRKGKPRGPLDYGEALFCVAAIIRSHAKEREDGLAAVLKDLIALNCRGGGTAAERHALHLAARAALAARAGGE